MITYLILLILPLFALAQVPVDVELQSLKTQLETNLLGQERYEKHIALYKTKSEAAKKEIDDLALIISNWPETKRAVESEIANSLNELPFSARTVGQKGKYYRCIRDNLTNTGTTGTGGCLRVHPVDLDPREKVLVQSWENKLGRPRREMENRVDSLRRDYNGYQNAIKQGEIDLESNLATRSTVEGRMAKLESILDELKFVERKEEFLKCDSSTPTINLEEEFPFHGASFKGPFHGIPRDNQDGLGTCYANAAKNLLLGISNGENNASFLDMALQFKKDFDGNLRDGVEGGESCATLEQTEKVGYCPQELSPTEIGENNQLAQGIFTPGASSVEAQSEVLKALGSFFKSKAEYEKKSKDLYMLSQVKMVIDEMKSNPAITIPVPVLRFDLPDKRKMNELWIHTLKKAMPKEQFMNDYEMAYREFRPHYIDAVLKGKTLDQVFDLMKIKMRPFIAQYKLEGSLETMKYSYIFDAKQDFDRPNLADRLKASIAFLRKYIKKDDLDDNDFLSYCLDGTDESLSFLQHMQSLLGHMNALKLDPNILIDENGNFKHANDLMQLAIAPSCLNKDNRRSFKHKFSCNYVYPSSMKGTIEVRKRILTSLLNGYPVGNTFKEMLGNHINTIVGMRFNKSSGQCEYLIRESQDGTSKWTLEQAIHQEVSNFTEVRRK